MLTAEAEVLWARYVHAEKDRARGETMTLLDRFIEALLRHGDEVWKTWARDLAGRVSDGSCDVPVRFPLFSRVLLAPLAEGTMLGVPGCARSLAHLSAQFAAHLVNTHEVPLPDSLRTEAGLLREAVRVDPGDRVARGRLVERLASGLAYSLHEVPAVVLFGLGSATAEQCSELLSLLAELQTHVEVLERESAFDHLISGCELHFTAYRDYLLSQPGGSYEEYLEARIPRRRRA